MIQRITIDILNEKAVQLLRELEGLQLIRLTTNVDSITIQGNQYKGAMSKQPIEEVNSQLRELRNAWE